MRNLLLLVFLGIARACDQMCDDVCTTDCTTIQGTDTYGDGWDDTSPYFKAVNSSGAVTEIFVSESAGDEGEVYEIPGLRYVMFLGGTWQYEVGLKINGEASPDEHFRYSASGYIYENWCPEGTTLNTEVSGDPCQNVDVCGVIAGDGTSCLDVCGVPNGGSLCLDKNGGRLISQDDTTGLMSAYGDLMCT